MKGRILLFLVLAGCGTTSRLPYGKFVIETHTTDLGSSCLTSSHPRLRGPDGALLLDPLVLWEVSGDRLWALAAGRDAPRALHLLDLEGGRIHSTHDLGVPAQEPGRLPFRPLQQSPDRDHILLERIESPTTRSLALFSFEPALRIRTLFREDGLVASVHELRRTFWAPDGTGLAFQVHRPPRDGPTRLFHVRYDRPEIRETGRSEKAPNLLVVDWSGGVPALE